MAMSGLILGFAGALWAGIVGAPAASQDYPAQASRIQIAETCREAGGLAWGIDGADAARDAQYGCITRAGWVACDHYSNCIGGVGTADGGAARRARRASRLAGDDAR